MHETIAARLNTIETTHQTDIIAARDIGSHAWGLASPASDYDIGLIFRETRDPNTIQTQTNSLPLDEFSDDQLEFKSWSLRRFTELLYQSNPSALLFASSSRHYWDEPAAFTALCDHALDTFNPANTIGAHRGKAKSNYRKYLLPTLEQRGETKHRQFTTTAYNPAPDQDGILTLQPLDDQDASPEQIHAMQLGTEPWELRKREEERHTWRIITPEYTDPAELQEAAQITARHPDTDTERTIDTETIAPADAPPEGDWEFRWGTTDRTIKRYLYIGEALMRADHIACTQTFPPAEFDALIDAYEALSAAERYTALPTATLREYADRKRAGEGSTYTPIPAQERIDDALESLLQAFQNPANHRDELTADDLNTYIRQC